MKNEIDWERRARELCEEHNVDRGMDDPEEAMLQLAREMADARAEEVANAIRYVHDEGCKGTSGNDHLRYGLLRAYDIARSFISKKKTREEVLEEALQAIARRSVVGDPHLRPAEWVLPRDERAAAIALRALEWKP